MYFNKPRNEIIFKIVYYGPGLSGKTANLEFIYSHLNPSLRGDLIRLKSSEGRTLFFDFMQLELGQIQDKKPRFNLYTIPGQAYYSPNRRIVLQGADSIVFVADSQRMQMRENLETLLDLESNLIQMNRSLSEFPWVIQYNKRDLANVSPLAVMEEKLNYYRVPSFQAVAPRGIGVYETLKEAINLAVAQVHSAALT